MDEENLSHWKLIGEEIRHNGAISASPNKLGLKQRGNSCSDPPSVNRNLAEVKTSPFDNENED